MMIEEDLVPPIFVVGWSLVDKVGSSFVKTARSWECQHFEAVFLQKKSCLTPSITLNATASLQLW